jgi:Asp-tRNA(Asn)/Glu-tRNA(Gln) amidotransferase A subunit family amidase
MGLQLVAAAWNEGKLLRAARAYERETLWGEQRPHGV